MATPVREVLPKLKYLMASDGLLPPGPELKPIRFESFVKTFSPQWQDYLLSEFCFSQRLIDLLLAQKLIGSYATESGRSLLLFPIADLVSGLVFRLECYQLDDQNRFLGPRYLFNKAYPITPLVVGNLEAVTQIHVHHSIMDMLAEIDAAGFYALDTIAFIATRNADIAQLERLESILAPDTEVILFPRRLIQEGNLSRQSLDEIQLVFRRRFLKVARIPLAESERNFGFGDWFKRYLPGAPDVARLIERAVLVEAQPAGENVQEPHEVEEIPADEPGKSRPRLDERLPEKSTEFRGQHHPGSDAPPPPASRQSPELCSSANSQAAASQAAVLPKPEAESTQTVTQKENHQRNRNKTVASPGTRSRQSGTRFDQAEIQSSDALTFQIPFFGERQSYRISHPFFARLWGTKRLAFYERASGDFYCYNEQTGCFDRLRLDEVCGMIRDDIIEKGLEHKRADIASKVNISLCRSIAELIKTDSDVCRTDFFAFDPISDPVIHVANGMVSFEGEEVCLRPFSPKYRSRNFIPIAYNPKARCERFLKELLEPMMSLEDIELLQRYAGLILLRGNRAQKALLLVGKGGTGKGTVLGIFILILGRKNTIQLRVDKLRERFETSRVIGKLLVHVNEATEDFLNQDGAEVIKSLTGHDRMEGEKKHVQEAVELDGRYPLIVVSNEQIRVRISGDEESWTRRLVIITCPRARAAEAPVINNFDQVLVNEEGEGILAWMIEGARKHWKELRENKGLSTTATQNARAEDLIARSKSVETFVQTQIERASDSDVTGAELYNAYTKYCISRKWTPVAEQRFEQSSRHLILRYWGVYKNNHTKRYGKDQRGYPEIALKETVPPEIPQYEWTH